MIILTGTTDKIQISLGSAVATTQLKCYASYRDTTSTTITPSRNVVLTTDTSAVDLIGSPGASTQRVVDYISIYNADTASATVTVNFNDNGTLYNLAVIILGVNEKLEYQEGEGFKVISTTGAYRIASNPSGITEKTALSFVYMSSDSGGPTSTSFVNITGLSFPVTANKTYWFRFVIPYTASNTTVGARFAINGPGIPSFLVYQTENSNGAAAIFNNRGITAYDGTSQASANAASLVSNLAIIEGVITPSSSGTVIARIASEVTATSTPKAGSFVKYLEI
jgi:hypothetical protein